MTLVELTDVIAKLTADLSLSHCSMGNISLPILQHYFSVLKNNRLDFEREIQNCAKDPATEIYIHQLYSSLTAYSAWYAEHYTEPTADDVKKEAKMLFEHIEVLWLPLIEEVFPKLMNDEGDKPA